MSKYPVWYAILAMLFCASLFFGGKASWHLYHYFRFSDKTLTQEVLFKVQPRERGRYSPKGSYTFIFQGKSYKGETVLDDPMYRNSKSIEEVIPLLKQRSWRVWYDPNDPNHSTLQKNLPVKECIYAAILIALFIYFWVVGTFAHMRRKHG